MLNNGFTESELNQLDEIIGNRSFMKNVTVINDKIILNYNNGFSSCNFENCHIEILK